MQHQTTIAARTNAKPLRRAMTDAERRLWSRLRGEQLGVKFRRQHPFGPDIADFACLDPKVVIEVDGSQHVDEKARDARRDAFFAEHGFVTLRFYANEVFSNTDGVLERILETIAMARAAAPTPTLPQRGREQHPTNTGEIA